MSDKTEKQYRDGLPEMPERILKLPIERGYPVPWFVCKIDGHYDFRVIDASKFTPAVKQKLCWICGEKLGTALAFSIGPMCAINRTISEPPSHRECAEFSIKACPFLTQQQVKRNEVNLPEGYQDSAGIGIKRQPGVICLWLTKSYQPFNAGNGVLFRLGEPDQVFWFREGRTATRDEVLESINSGLPILREMAEKDGSQAVLQLEKQIRTASELLPSESPKKTLFGSAIKR